MLLSIYQVNTGFSMYAKHFWAGEDVNYEDSFICLR